MLTATELAILLAVATEVNLRMDRCWLSAGCYPWRDHQILPRDDRSVVAPPMPQEQ